MNPNKHLLKLLLLLYAFYRQVNGGAEDLSNLAQGRAGTGMVRSPVWPETSERRWKRDIEKQQDMILEGLNGAITRNVAFTQSDIVDHGRVLRRVLGCDPH